MVLNSNTKGVIVDIFIVVCIILGVILTSVIIRGNDAERELEHEQRYEQEGQPPDAVVGAKSWDIY